jgi:hypothetical protein
MELRRQSGKHPVARPMAGIGQTIRGNQGRVRAHCGTLRQSGIRHLVEVNLGDSILFFHDRMLILKNCFDSKSK